MTKTKDRLLPLLREILKVAYRTTFKIKIKRVQGEILVKLNELRNLIHSSHLTQIVTTTKKGFKMRLNLAEHFAQELYYGFPFEETELKIVRTVLKQGDIFFDIGAHWGIYTLLASKIVESNGSVHSFEPAPEAFAILKKNLALNKINNVWPNQIAVSEKTRKAVKLFINRETDLTSLGKTYRGKISKIIKVDTNSPDRYVKSNKIKRVDFLKIDVEGLEGKVLKGTQNLLKKSENLLILYELAEKNFKTLHFSINNVINWMQNTGYQVWVIKPQKPFLVSFDKNSRIGPSQNFLFTKRLPTALKEFL